MSAAAGRRLGERWAGGQTATWLRRLKRLSVLTATVQLTTAVVGEARGVQHGCSPVFVDRSEHTSTSGKAAAPDTAVAAAAAAGSTGAAAVDAIAAPIAWPLCTLARLRLGEYSFLDDVGEHILSCYHADDLLATVDHWEMAQAEATEESVDAVKGH